MAYTTQTDVLQDMSFLLGESTVPTSGIEDRQRYIQRTLERVYRAHNFPMHQVTATLTVTSGAGTIPSTIHQDGIVDVREVVTGTNNDLIYTQVAITDLDNYGSGDYRYALTGYEGSGTYTISTSETGSQVLTVRGEGVAPTINGSIGTPFPSPMCLAQGALVYYRMAEDPQADVSQQEALFQNELDEVIAQYNRNRDQQRALSAEEAAGTFIGDVETWPGVS
jgi:hypothetical protein